MAEVSRLQLVLTRNEDELARVNQKLLAITDTLMATRNDLQKSLKRTQRLEREKKAMKSVYKNRTRKITAKRRKTFTNLSCLASEAKAKAEKLSALLKEANQSLLVEKEANTMLRTKAHRLEMQSYRARKTLRTVRQHINKLRTWNSSRKGTFTPEARRLARTLLRAGCAGDRVGDAIAACARAFCITVARLPSRRTVFRARDEGGQFGLMQLGREIVQSDGKAKLLVLLLLAELL